MGGAAAIGFNAWTSSRSASRKRRKSANATTNLVMLLFFVAIVGIGIWLANALLEARRADECIAQGRRNCTPIETPAR
jgi:hypothetical protein